MKKKHSIARFILISVLCAIFAVLTIFSFSLPGSSKDYDFVGFARAINLGIEYRGGTVATYSVQLNSTNNQNIQEGIASNATRIKYLLDNEGYDTNVYQNGEDIVVEYFDEYFNEESAFDLAEIVNDIINEKPYFAIKTEQGDDKDEIVKPTDVESVIATTSGSQNVLFITFTKEGAENFQKVIDKGTGYFYIGSSNFSMSLSKDSVTKEYIGIVVSSLETAKNYASQIKSAKYDMTLKLYDNITSFEKMGTRIYTSQEANRNVVMLICLTVGIFLAIVISLVCIYKTMGLVGGLIMLIGILLQIILLQAIPTSVLTFTVVSSFASMLAMALGGLSLFVMFRSMSAEYQKGKIISASVKFGYNKVWKFLLDMFILLAIPTIIAFIFGTFVVKQFAIAFICGLAVYGLVTLLFGKYFTKWLTYIKFKNTDYGFKREANVDELK